jgi:hypothetical protein
MTSPGLRVRVNLLARSYFGYPQTVQAVDDALCAGNFSDIGFYQVSNQIMFVTTNIIPYLMFIVTNIYVVKIL